MRGRGLLALLLWAVAVPAAAQTRTLPCAPPDAADLRLTLEQGGWGRDGAPWRVTILRDLHVGREPGGFAVTVQPARATTSMAQAEARRMADAFAGEAPVTLHLDPAGELRGIDDLDTHWSAYVARLTRLAQEAEASGEARGRARSMASALAAADARTRMETIAGRAGPLFRLCGQSVEAAPVDGDAGLLLVTEQRESEGLAESVRTQVDAASGLVRSVARRAVPRAQPARALEESWRYETIAP